MKLRAWLVIAYAVLLLMGGIIGFRAAHSIPSLVMGTLSSFLLFGSARAFFKEKACANKVALLFVGFLTLFFSYRFALTQKMMPAGMMALISAVLLILLWKLPYAPKKLVNEK